MDQVRVIERSLRCFTAGWLGLIPLLGLVPATVAVILFHQVRAETGGNWNPAHAHVKCGYVLGCIGLLLSGLWVGGVMVVVVNRLM